MENLKPHSRMAITDSVTLFLESEDGRRYINCTQCGPLPTLDLPHGGGYSKAMYLKSGDNQFRSGCLSALRF